MEDSLGDLSGFIIDLPRTYADCIARKNMKPGLSNS